MARTNFTQSVREYIQEQYGPGSDFTTQDIHMVFAAKSRRQVGDALRSLVDLGEIIQQDTGEFYRPMPELTAPKKAKRSRPMEWQVGDVKVVDTRQERADEVERAVHALEEIVLPVLKKYGRLLAVLKE